MSGVNSAIKSAIKAPFKGFIKLGYSMRGLSSIVRFAKRPNYSTAPTGRELVIMGNGPSLNTYLAKPEVFADRDTMCVNFFGLADDFMRLRPRYYTLADPAFFLRAEERLSAEISKIAQLYDIFCHQVDWPMDIIVPSVMVIPDDMRAALTANANIRIVPVNGFYFEGFDWLTSYLRRRRLMSFEFQNVLIMGLSAAVFMGYKTIYLMGADHDWIKNFIMDEENHLHIQDTHFYGENPPITPLRDIDGRWVTMAEEMRAQLTAFSQYEKVAVWARTEGVKIYNTYGRSFVDAFEKINLQPKSTVENGGVTSER